jgi:uncharacterized membrane protein
MKIAVAYASFQIDSLLGATLQKTRYSRQSKRVLQDDTAKQQDELHLGGIGVLTNNQVS